MSKQAAPDELENEDCPDCGNTRVCQHCSGSGDDPDGPADADGTFISVCPLCKGSGICPYCREQRKGE